ncbi:MAG: hypothetical protein E7369_03600 [Clostridiales bacterium]|nr:hypothetical protein [Clostridiales bacterium]
MKKTCITFLTLAIIFLTAFGMGFFTTNQKTEYLRIHIRANSNLEVDQSVKLLVKNSVVEFMTPKIAECSTKSDAERVIKENISLIEAVCDRVLETKGFCYRSKAKLTAEEFPTRAYGDVVLESGYYDALIIELGDGKGDNWWCVVYPPLCFVGEGGGYVYQSKILNVIREFFKDK